jgi:hypothetical protein
VLPKVNWAAVSAVAALIGVGILYWQVSQQAALSRFTTGIDSLWHLDDRWDTEMTATRRKAAASLLAKDPTMDVDAVIDFFELLALLVNRQILDPEMAWHAYYWPLANYWAASSEYVRAARQEEGSTTWQDVEGLSASSLPSKRASGGC